MERDVLWRALRAPGLEHLHVSMKSGGLTVTGLIIGVEDGSPFRIGYWVLTDAGGAVREVQVQDHLGRVPPVALFADGHGRWIDSDVGELPALDGCLDVDISATPFTNTLPIRRLHLLPGDSCAIHVAYVSVPELVVSREEQVYTCLANDLYRFESDDFQADIGVDADGLVVDYPGLFTRIWAG
ncbi:putative glycolipid-binding domain-containing protein [Aggregatilinea lenta]|uniref:putative glycolipid-binding domain-containing protein n=1 Tax=Aggregatilinea lenta TaxID=913108 RepID=UPI000E5BE02F|nr:putative glycolipid-binding domain-containing protein [Aggregatilinea lenta]